MPRTDYLRLGVQQLSELLHQKHVPLATLNAHRKIVSLRGVAHTASKKNGDRTAHQKLPPCWPFFLEHHMSQGHNLRYCVALLEQAVTPQLLQKYTEQERDVELLTLRLGGRRLLHTFYKAGIVPSSPFLKQFQRAENPFNLQGHLRRDKVRTLLGSIWSGLERCPIHTLKDDASLLPRLSVARDPVENGLFFVGLCDCVKERIPYTGIQSVINVMKHLSNGDWHLARHVSICGVARHSREMHAMVPISFKLTCNIFTAEDEAQSFRDLFRMWEPLAPVFEPIATLNSDGDAHRTKCFASFDQKPVDFSPRLPLCDVTLTHFGATTNADRRHIDKRIRGVLIGSHAMKGGDTVISILCPFLSRRCSANWGMSTSKATASPTPSTSFVNEETKVQRITLEFCAVPPATRCLRPTTSLVVHGPGSGLLRYGTERTPIGLVLPVIVAVWETT